MKWDTSLKPGADPRSGKRVGNKAFTFNDGKGQYRAMILKV
jgi:hypothetical protein